MKDIEGIEYYSPIEEKINIISHAAGFILSIVAFVLLVMRASLHGDVWQIVSFSIFGASLTSTLHKFLIFYFQIITLLFATHQENPKDPCAQPGWHSW